MTIIEGIEVGLHPQTLEVIVDVLWVAAQRTQIIATTHSPTLLDLLRQEEIILCDRDTETGTSIIPAVGR